MEHGFTITWNFFATSHGKGVVDGIGGTVKRAIWRHVKAERAHVTNASEYSTLGTKVCPNILVKFIPKEEIAQQTMFLDSKWENVRAIPQTHHIHCVKAHGSNLVQVPDTTDDTEVRICQIKVAIQEQADERSLETESHTLDIATGQWVVVTYDEAEYPGEVTSISNDNTVQVNVMHRSGSGWKWPQSKDMILYDKKDIVRVISPPIAAGNRGQFVFNDFKH